MELYLFIYLYNNCIYLYNNCIYLFISFNSYTRSSLSVPPLVHVMLAYCGTSYYLLIPQSLSRRLCL